MGLNHFRRTLTRCSRMISGEADWDAACDPVKGLTLQPRDIMLGRVRNRRNMMGRSVEARQQERGGRRVRGASRVV